MAELLRLVDRCSSLDIFCNIPFLLSVPEFDRYQPECHQHQHHGTANRSHGRGMLMTMTTMMMMMVINGYYIMVINGY